MNLLIKLLIVLTVFYSSFTYSHSDSPYVPAEDVSEYCINAVCSTTISGLVGAYSSAVGPLSYRSTSTCTLSTSSYFHHQGTKRLEIDWDCNPNTPGGVDYQKSTATYYYTANIGKQCIDPNYPNGEDTDGDGEVDHCHTSDCTGLDFYTLPPHFSNFSFCLAQPSGEYCKYESTDIYNHTYEDGTTVGYTVLNPTTATCGSDVNNLPHDVYDPNEDDEIPDPSDPSNPPTDDGNPECTPIQGTTSTVCSAQESEVCVNGVCPAGCGTINNSFVCIQDGNNDNITPVGDGSDSGNDNDDTNDNSDNQDPDDSSTAGDEGTHSRLDGLLQNTDGIEGLLKQIRDNTEKEDCTGNTYLIGDKCIRFDKSAQPDNSQGLDFGTIDGDIQNAKDSISSEYNNIKSSLQTMFNVSLTGGAYSSNNATVHGVDVDFGMARLSNMFGFSLFGALIMFVASVRSAFIILGAKS